jgi:threonine dehydratase
VTGRTTLEDVLAARDRLRSTVLRTPLIPLDASAGHPGTFLKLESLQPTGSFKVRGAGNALAVALERGPAKGVYTTSAGNMAQALAWHAQRLGIPCTVIVPDTAPETKLAGMRRYGARIIQLPWDEVWKVAMVGRYGPLEDLVFVHPFNDRQMIAGNGTAGLEILEDLPGVGTIFVPFGGGGLIAGIATAVRALHPATDLVACEPETAAPFAASLKAGHATEVARTPSFTDGIGAQNVLPEMWERLRGLVELSRVLPLEQIANAARFCVERHHLVVEGAGAAGVAAAFDPRDSKGPIVAVVSGGNIDPKKLALLLDGKVPGP